MQKSGLMPDQFTFGSIIRSCSSLSSIELGRQLHVHVIKSEFGSHLIAQNALIAMYTKFGQIADALDGLRMVVMQTKPCCFFLK
ncbi:hypothetical protein CsSME_00026332 [Camellia sinensis var. sinensis]